MDAHGHLMHLARGRLTLDLRGADSEEAAARRVGERAARLPRGERDVLLLVALADLSYDEVAQALGLKTGTVASRLHRARRRLREALGTDRMAAIVEEATA